MSQGTSYLWFSIDTFVPPIRCSRPWEQPPVAGSPCYPYPPGRSRQHYACRCRPRHRHTHRPRTSQRTYQRPSDTGRLCGVLGKLTTACANSPIWTACTRNFTSSPMYNLDSLISQARLRMIKIIRNPFSKEAKPWKFASCTIS